MFNQQGRLPPLRKFINVMVMGIISLIVGVIAAAVSLGVGLHQSNTNKQLVDDTNATNLQIAQETNASNVEQANLAYQRSLPFNQIRNLMDAGYSRAGALGALTGGGSYTAPTLQSDHMQAPQMDLSSVSAAMERFQNIPSNVQQSQLINEQRKALQVDTQNKINADLRAEEAHKYDMWQKMHGKNATEMIDNLSSFIVSTAADKGISLDNIDSIDKLVSAFDLKTNKDWLSMPKNARDEVLTGVRLQAAENRARQSQNNANLAAKDAHQAALDALKNSEVSRSLSHQQYNKLLADTEAAWQNVEAFRDATDARQKENAARAARADFEKIMAQFGISEKQLRDREFWTRDSDGNYVPTFLGDNKSQIANAWNFVGTFFGVDLLQDILRGLVTIAPK